MEVKVYSNIYVIFISINDELKHEIVTTSGELSSPRFPDYYPAKKDCVWIFSTTPGHRIKLVCSI